MSASAASNAYASGFDIKDFKIKSFGIQNDNPFLKVEDTTGGTKPSIQYMDTCIRAISSGRDSPLLK
jgi:hypothetical protein